MSSRSWLVLSREDPRHRPAERQADRGWVEQMLPFLRNFSRAGDAVVDPFCGWGTTLVACALEGRKGIGLEIDRRRARFARRRMDSYGGPDQTVLVADSRQPPLAAESADLCLTNIPYFGAGWNSGHDGQLYRQTEYDGYLTELEMVFSAMARVLKPGTYIVAMAENIQLHNGKFISLAWDAGRALSRHFTMCPERLLCYRRPLPDDPDPARTNRSHEYALIGKKD